MIKQVFKWATVVMSCVLVAALATFGAPAEAGASDKGGMKVTGPGGYASLAAKAKAAGSVQVLVRVEAPFAVEPSLPEDQVLAQRSSILSAQEQVIAEVKRAGKNRFKVYQYKYVPYLAMTVDGAGLATLAASPHVAGIQEDIAVPPATDWSVPLIGASTLQGAGVDGTGVTIAILDTGVAKDHPFLRHGVVSEACYSTNSARSYSLCRGGVSESTKVDSALPYWVCPESKCDHGTHVAGIAAGRDGVAGSPGPGVAPGADMIAIQVFSGFESASDCNGRAPCVKTFISDQIKGLERVYDLRSQHTIAAVNMSLGGGQYDANCDDDSRKAIIDNLRAAGIATIIASGNEGYCGSMSSPGCISTAVSVGATNDSDFVGGFSNSASFLSLFAPGVDIDSSIPGAKYAYKSGTSMAAPHVAGAWALMKQGHPSATVDSILNAFTSTGVTVTDVGKCPAVAKQRINVNDAYNLLGPTAILEITVRGTSKGYVSNGGPTCASGSTCKWPFAPGATAILAAVPAPGAHLDDWIGCDTITLGGVVCNVTMTNPRTVTAVFNPPPRISVSTPSIHFGPVTVGNAPYRAFSIRNTGVSSLALHSITPRALDPSFTVDSTGCPADLAKGQACWVYVTFAPTNPGLATGFIDIASDGSETGLTTVSIRGTGEAAGAR